MDRRLSASVKPSTKHLIDGMKIGSHFAHASIGRRGSGARCGPFRRQAAQHRAQRSGAVLFIPWVSKGQQPFGALFGPFPALEKGLAPQRETLRINERLAMAFLLVLPPAAPFLRLGEEKGKKKPSRGLRAPAPQG